MRPRIPLPPELTEAPFTTRDARTRGVNRGRLRGSDLETPFRGVRVVAGSEPDLPTRCAALALRAPEDAFFCGATAAQLLSVPLPPWLVNERSIHIGVFSPATAPIGRGVRGHVLQLDPAEVWMLGGLRLLSPAQTWCALGSLLAVPDLVAAGDFLIHHRSKVATRAELLTALNGMAGKRGVRRLRDAHQLLNDRAESPQESKLRVILVGAAVPGLAANVEIRTSGGYRYRGDLVVPDRKLVIEYQSAFHEISERFRQDMTRISRLEADGWMVVQVNRDDLDDPFELVARIRHALVNRPIFPGEL